MDDSRTPQTALEEIVTLPEQLAERELHHNQKRARFIARDISDYARSVPAGFALDSDTIRTVLKANEEETPHNQSICRVVDFLQKFGEGDVKKCRDAA